MGISNLFDIIFYSMSVDNVEPFTWEELSGYLSKPFELFEKVMIFLATHPTPVGVVNNVSAVFSY